MRRWHTGAVRDAFALDPDLTHLNHGSFGAVPRVVSRRQREVRDRAEANPMRFHRVELPGLRAAAREVAAGFLGVRPDEAALVRNVTEAAATVVASLVEQRRLGRGDVVVLNSQTYESVRRTVASWCARTGATYRVVDVPVEAKPADVTAGYAAAVASGDVRLVVVDAVTSTTGALLPVTDICEVAARHGSLSFVDGAHVLGQLAVVPSATGADFWTGTWHKWGFAPRGTSVLWAAPAERDRLRPLTTSWNAGLPFPLPFDTHGTDDYSGWLSLDAAVAFWREAGGRLISERSRRMLDDAAAMLTGVLGTSAPVPVDPAPCLRLVPLPAGVACDEEAADALYQRLSAAGVEVQVVAYDGQGYVRLSGAVYNEPADYARLAELLPRVV